MTSVLSDITQTGESRRRFFLCLRLAPGADKRLYRRHPADQRLIDRRPVSDGYQQYQRDHAHRSRQTGNGKDVFRDE